MGRVLIGLLMGWAMAMAAEPTKTTIQDMVYLADGSRFSGRAEVEWATFTASGGTVVPGGKIISTVIDGVLDIQLIPTTNASLGASYRVRFLSSRNLVSTERWYVSPSVLTLSLSEVRTGSSSGSGGGGGPATVGTVTINDVQGLSTELANRPIRSGSYLPNRALKSDGAGSLAAVTGASTDCVRVDGTSSPCGSGGGTGGGTSFNGSALSNLVIGNDIEWVDQGSGTFRIQVAGTIPRSSLGTDAPTGACTAGHTWVTSKFYYCDATGAWKEAAAGTGSAAAALFPDTGWTASNSSNVTWVRSGDGKSITATVGGTDQGSLAVYCRTHTGASAYLTTAYITKNLGVTPMSLAGLSLRGTAYRGIFLGFGGMGNVYEVSGYTFSGVNFGMSGFTAAGQAVWGSNGVELGLEDTGTDARYSGPFLRGSEGRNSPTQVCLGVQGPAGQAVAFVGWK